MITMTATEWLWAIPLNWTMPWIISWIYVGWLWKVSGDVSFEGWIYFWKVIPVARFRLISKKSWYAKMWKQWYGFALMLVMIHRDEKGKQDDEFAEEVIVHELRHNKQCLVLGLLHWILYGLDNVRLRIFTKKDAYADNWFERDAEKAARNWIYNGRPKVYGLGKRY
jgi:hypothetical protein